MCESRPQVKPSSGFSERTRREMDWQLTAIASDRVQ
jgi:hypothetical protein